MMGGCKIQLCETRRAQTLEHGAEKYRIQVTSNVVPSSGCRQHWEALLTSEKFLPFCVILEAVGCVGVCWRAFKGLRWMLVAPRVRPPLGIEAVEYSLSRPTRQLYMQKQGSPPM